MGNEKIKKPALIPTINDQYEARRIFLTDQKTKMALLVDTGADLCVFPRTKVRYQLQKCKYKLYAANGSCIATYGTITLELNFGLRRNFKWRFVVADVGRSIIGMDFLSYYGLLVDVRRKLLVDETTQLTAKGSNTGGEVAEVSTTHSNSLYYKILVEYPELTKPAGIELEHAKHNTTHQIKTTSGPPVFSKPRRLATDRLKSAKTEFELML